jgi:hypothetical protein
MFGSGNMNRLTKFDDTKYDMPPAMLRNFGLKINLGSNATNAGCNI